MRYRKNHHRTESAELNITAFMNLMVILVPFLLITAVFSQMSILEMSLPASAASEAPPEEEPFQLEIIVRHNMIEVADKQGGLIKTIPMQTNETDIQANSDTAERALTHDYTLLHETLLAIKAQKPDLTDVTLLLEDDILYDTLIQVMDASRIAKQANEQGIEEDAELFPNISVGTAPPAPQGSQTEASLSRRDT